MCPWNRKLVALVAAHIFPHFGLVPLCIRVYPRYSLLAFRLKIRAVLTVLNISAGFPLLQYSADCIIISFRTALPLSSLPSFFQFAYSLSRLAPQGADDDASFLSLRA